MNFLDLSESDQKAVIQEWVDAHDSPSCQHLHELPYNSQLTLFLAEWNGDSDYTEVASIYRKDKLPKVIYIGV